MRKGALLLQHVVFSTLPPKQDKTGEREKRVCVTAAGFCGCESSHFHTFLDEMRRGKEEAKEKKRKLIGIRFGWKSKTKRNCKKACWHLIARVENAALESRARDKVKGT